jgi:UDP-N-acetyl-2-amino-2-deoxyglucuronate dehydrogenase
VLDSHFPDAHFFVEFERFDRHIDKLRRRGAPLHFVSICSPNYLHDSHIRFGLRSGAHVICEKPLVLNPWNIDGLLEMEQETGQRVYNVLQLRLHPVIRALHAREQSERQKTPGKKREVELAYITSRGRWYHASWKGNAQKSGGIATNIGVHFFDMLQWVFGPVLANELHVRTDDVAAGYLELEHARVRWFLSIDQATLPLEIQQKQQRTYRSIRIDGEELEFSEGFTDLHTATYRDIMGGGGFGLEEARPAITLVHDIREATVNGDSQRMHPMAKALIAGGVPPRPLHSFPPQR